MKKIANVENLSYSYSGVRAVNDVSFSLDKGKVLALLGPNGAGKTTIMKILTGQLEVQEGNVMLFGQKLGKNLTDIKGKIGVCFEEKNIYENMSARENLEFFAKLFGIKNYDARKSLERVNLVSRLDDRVSTFSKGMRQRLMIARTLINTPEIFFLDEPTSGLDPMSSQSIREIVKEEVKRGACVFLTTHDMHEADQLSDEVAFLNEGSIVALDTPENLKVKHGKSSVKIRVRNGEKIETLTLSLTQKDVGEKIKGLIESKTLVTIHTEESNLEDIFIKLTGRRLE